MTNFELQTVTAINNIAMQVEGLNNAEIGPNLMVVGDQSPFDSFAMLLLLVELEGSIEPNLLGGRSLVDWFSSLDFSDSLEMNVQQFSDLLFKDYLNAKEA